MSLRDAIAQEIARALSMARVSEGETSERILAALRTELAAHPESIEELLGPIALVELAQCLQPLLSNLTTTAEERRMMLHAELARTYRAPDQENQ